MIVPRSHSALVLLVSIATSSLAAADGRATFTLTRSTPTAYARPSEVEPGLVRSLDADARLLCASPELLSRDSKNEKFVLELHATYACSSLAPELSRKAAQADLAVLAHVRDIDHDEHKADACQLTLAIDRALVVAPSVAMQTWQFVTVRCPSHVRADGSSVWLIKLDPARRKPAAVMEMLGAETAPVFALAR
jgi:hypothetical protein